MVRKSSRRGGAALPGHPQSRYPFRRWRGRQRRQVLPTFRDPELDACLDRDGFVVIDLLSSSAAGNLLAAHDRLDHVRVWENPFAEGFHTTIYDQREVYRRDVHDVMATIVEPELVRWFDHPRMILANFAVKRPGGGPVPCHPDWTFVDETRCRSVTVWCALTDIDDLDGTLGVVAGSHRQVDFARPLNVRDYDRYVAVAAAAASARSVPLRAGQAIVFDSRTLHFSYPNLTGSPRVAAACVVVPAEATIGHFFVEADGRVRHHDVDSTFYFHYFAGADPEGVIGAAHGTEVTVTYA